MNSIEPVASVQDPDTTAQEMWMLFKKSEGHRYDRYSLAQLAEFRYVFTQAFLMGLDFMRVAEGLDDKKNKNDGVGSTPDQPSEVQPSAPTVG